MTEVKATTERAQFAIRTEGETDLERAHNMAIEHLNIVCSALSNIYRAFGKEGTEQFLKDVEASMDLVVKMAQEVEVISFAPPKDDNGNSILF